MKRTKNLGFACAFAIVLGNQADVFAQGQEMQVMATSSDVRQGDEIIIRKGKVFLKRPDSVPAEGIRLDTSETPLALNVRGNSADGCYTIVNEGPGAVRLRLAPRPANAPAPFKDLPPPEIAEGSTATVCPPQSPVDIVANVVVSIAVQRGAAEVFEPSDVLSFSAAAPAPERGRVIDMKLRSSTTQNQSQDVYEAVVRLDGTGISDWRFLNPRRLHRVCVHAEIPLRNGVPARGDSPAECTDRADAVRVDLVFENTLSDRALDVKFGDIPLDQRGSFLEAGLNVSCSGGTCTASIRIDPKAQVPLRVRTLQGAYAPGISGPPVQFTVSKFIEDVPLANSRGYFTVVALANTKELPSKTAWSFIGQGTAMYEPDLTGLFPPCEPKKEKCSNDASITTDRTVGGEQRTHVTGTVRLGFTQSIGARADADVEVQLKKGDLGGDAATVQVTPTKYRLNINASNGSVISGGRYTFAEPAQSIAISESGEGVSVRFRYFEIGHLFKRETGEQRVQRLLRDASDESGDNDRDIEDGDHSTTIAQVREVSTPGGHFRLNAIVLNGRSTPLGVKTSYWTGGGDATYLFPAINATQTLSWYHSWRNSSAPLKDGSDKATGTAWLATSNYTNLDRSKPDSPSNDFTLAFLVGRGSGDSADTPSTREDYLGETASFSPDLIFLNTLAGSFGIDPATEGRVGKGLSNKVYLGLVADTPRFSLLSLVAWALRTSADTAKDGSGTTLSYHWYRLNEPVLGEHFAGQEIDVTFRIESPAKVKYSFSTGLYFPGAAIKTMVTQTQWKVQGNVSVKM